MLDYRILKPRKNAGPNSPLLVMLPLDNVKYMPFKEKKPGWTQDEITTFKNWMRQGMPN